MIFASKMPRDLSHDPYPWAVYVWPHAPEINASMRYGTEDEAIRQAIGSYVHGFKPRPEFDHVQHNEPNPILVAFRNRAEDVTLDYWAWALEAEAAFGGWSSWNHSDHPAHSLTIATDAQIEHARRVLERLAKFSG